jgi:hypothetical protein
MDVGGNKPFRIVEDGEVDVAAWFVDATTQKIFVVSEGSRGGGGASRHVEIPPPLLREE